MIRVRELLRVWIPDLQVIQGPSFVAWWHYHCSLSWPLRQPKGVSKNVLIDRELGTCIANVNVTLDAVSEHVRKDIGPVKSERRRSKVRHIPHGSEWQGTLTRRRRMSDKSCFLTGFNEPKQDNTSGSRQGIPENSFYCPIMVLKMMITDPKWAMDEATLDQASAWPAANVSFS